MANRKFGSAALDRPRQAGGRENVRDSIRIRVARVVRVGLVDGLESEMDGLAVHLDRRV